MCSAASLLQQLNAEVVEQSLKTKDLDAFKPGDSVEVQVQSCHVGLGSSQALGSCSLCAAT